jgi:AcrR family transcriptional regulator
MAVNVNAEKIAESRRKILNAASNLFLHGGVAALSVRAIAKRAGLSTIGIYSHFQGKQGILDALYIEGFGLVFDAMDVNPEGKIQREDVLQAARGYIRVGREHEAHYRLIFGESDRGYKPSEEAVVASQRAFEKLVSLAGGFLPSASTLHMRQQLALDIWAIVHGYVSISHHAIAGQGWDLDEMAIEAVATHLDAVPSA